jgi:hypothetical protein
VKAPKNVRDYFKSLPKNYLERVEVNNDILTLATKYIEEKVVDKLVSTTVFTLQLPQFIEQTF